MPTWRIETRGSVLLGTAVALGAAGLLKVDGVLLALGASAGILLLLCLGLGCLNLRMLQLGFELPKVVQAGDPVRMRLSVANPRRLLDGFGLELEMEVPGGLVQDCQVPWVPAASSADAELRVVIPGRGHGTSVHCELRSRFPLGLFRISDEREIEHPLLVLPRPMVPSEMQSLGRSVESEPERSVVFSEAMGEPRGLREYRAGDAAKVIAWPASLRSHARGGGLLVRELDPPGFHPQRVVILFHSYATDGALIRPDRFERALSLTWGAMRHFQSRGVPLRLLADFEEWVPRRVATRRQLGQAGEVLARTMRSRGTEEHELHGRLLDLDRDEALVVVSDMPALTWKGLLADRRGAVVVDVTAYEAGRRERRRRA
ncbi:MAG: DUF58 domain-containing protein [Verrucomicrobiota bacterium]